MEQTDKKSYKLVWIVAASLGVFVLVLGAAIYLVMQSSPERSSSSTASTITSTGVASADKIRQGLTDLSTSLDQAKNDKVLLEKASNSDKNQIRVGN